MTVQELCERRNQLRRRSAGQQRPEETVGTQQAQGYGLRLPEITPEMQVGRGLVSPAAIQTAQDTPTQSVQLGAGFRAIARDGIFGRDPAEQPERNYVITREQAVQAYGDAGVLESQLQQQKQRLDADYRGLLASERGIRQMEQRLDGLMQAYEKDPSQTNYAIWEQAYNHYIGMQQDYRTRYDAYASACNAYNGVLGRYDANLKTYNDYVGMFAKEDGSLDYELLAQAAEGERDRYLMGPERQQYLDGTRAAQVAQNQSYLRGGTAQLGYLPGQGTGYARHITGAMPHGDSREQELRSLASYYRGKANEQADEERLAEQLKAMESWTEEEKRMLEFYAANQQGSLASMTRSMMAGLTGGQNDGAIEAEAYRVFAQLASKYGADTVRKYAESWSRYKNAQTTQQLREGAKKNSNGFWGGVAGSLGSVAANVAGSVTAPLGALGDAVTRTGQYRTLDPNIAANLPNVYSTAVRENVAGNIEGSWAGKLGSTLYQAGMSAADNLARLAVSGGNEAISLGLAATGSFGQTMSEASSKGATPFQATVMALGAGALEVLTEKISLDKLLSDVAAAPKSGGEILKRALTAGAVEVSEEEMSFLGNLVLEMAVLRSGTDYNRRVGELVDGGMSYREAVKTADRELGEEIVNTGVQSFLSGGMLSGGTNLIGYAKDTPNRRAVKGLYLKDGDIQTMIMAGLKAEPDSVPYQVAAMMQEKIGAGEELSNAEVLLLHKVNGQALQGAAQTELDEGAKVPSAQDQHREQAAAEAPAAQSAPQQAQTAAGRVSINPGVQVKAQKMSAAQRLSELTGREIVFYYSSNRNQNGYYNPNDGKIYLNTNGARAAEVTFAHELTHSVERAGAYGQLRDAAFAWMKVRGMDIDAQRQQVRSQYAENGIQLRNREDVDREMVARFVEQELLTNEQSIRDVVRYDRTLGQKILNWIDGLLAKFQNKKAQERVLLENARRYYAQALKETETGYNGQRAATGTQTVTGTQTATGAQTVTGDQTAETGDPDEVRGLQLGEQFEDSEEFDDFGQFEDSEEFDDYFETLMQDEEESGAARSYSFGGESAETADLEALERAKRLERQGVAAETIRRQTGWFKGRDGKWRWEIDDSGMQYHAAGDALFSEMHPEYARHQELMRKWLYGELTAQEEAEFRGLDEVWGRERQRLKERADRGNAQLQNMIRHDALFEAYPWLRGTKVRFAELPEGTRGQYNSDRNEIVLNNSLRRAPESTLIHEIQHAIQKAEGFASGASTEYWDGQQVAKPEYAEEVRRAEVALDQAEARFRREWSDDINLDLAKRYVELDSRVWGEGSRELDESVLQELTAQMEQIEQAAAESGWDDLLNDYYYAAGELQMAKYRAKLNRRTSLDLYRNTAGEIEARDAAARRTMTPEERKNTPPDLGGEETVFVEGGIGESHSIAPIKGESGDYGLGVILDTNLFDGVKTRDWNKVLSRFVYEHLAGTELTVYDDDGHLETIYLARKNDRVQKVGAKNSHRVIDELARNKGGNIKALATVHLSELLETSRYDNTTSESDHQWLDENGWEHRKAYIQDRQGRIYEATLNIANGRDRRILYAVNNIRQIDKRVAHGAVPSTDSGRGSHIKSNSSAESIPQTGKGVKQFSISGPVEESGDLIAMHNVSAEKLLRTIRLGGMPMPSIAITKSGFGYTDYGDISVLFRKSSIDPQADSRNKVYSGDAMTPTLSRVDTRGKTPEQLLEEMLKLDRSMPYDEWKSNDASDLFGYAAKSYESLEQVRENRGRLVENWDEYAADATTAEWFYQPISEAQEILDELAGPSGSAREAAYDAMIDGIKGRHDTGAIMDVFRGNGFELTDRQAETIRGAYEKLSQMPTPYFEAKPERVVRPDEWALVALPDDADPELRQELEKLGVPVAEYRSGDTASRVAAVNSVPELQFSISEDDDVPGLSLPEAESIGDLQAELYQLQSQRASMLESDPDYVLAEEKLRYANTLREKVEARKAINAAVAKIDTAEIDQRISAIQDRIYDLRTGDVRRHRGEQEKYSGTKTAGYSKLPDSRLRQLDDAYREAVESGDYERITQLVDRAAEAAMPKSVVRDGAGRLLKVYHYTGNRFTVFDRSMARTGTEMDGFFFAPDSESTREYGPNVIVAYLNITNLAMDPYLSRKFNDSGTLLREKLAYQGYDGVARTENGHIYEYMAFDPEQIKSAEPIVYDDAGNVIPLSKRFDFRNADIRYSISEDDDVPGLSLPEVEEEAEADAQRKALPATARDYLERAERKFVKILSEGLVDANATVPRAVRTERLMPIVQKISEEYLRTGALDQELATELFDWTFAESVVRDTEFYDQYKDVLSRLRGTAVTLSKQDQSDIPDFNLWRKSAFGTLKIVNNGGLPVDTFYDELRGMAPELFPDSITHPADQLQRMYQVGQMIRVTEKSLQEFFGPETERRKQWARYDFDNAMNRMLPELRQVRRYGEDAAARAAREAAEVPATAEDAGKAFEQMKSARREYERTASRHLLTQEDEQVVYQLLRGERTPESLDPNDSATAGILAVYKAKQAYEDQAKIITKYKRKHHADLRAKADAVLGTVRDWKDKAVGLVYSRETMRRNILDIVPDRDLAKRIVAEYFDPVQTAEAASTRFKTEFRDRVRKLGLSRRVDKKAGNIVSEAHAVQLLGEATDNIEYLRKRRKYKGQDPTRGGKTMEEWQAVVDDLWANNPGLDANKIEGAVREFRKIYDELFRQMNEVRVRNGYEPINYLQGYFPHFQPGDGDGILAAFGRGLGIDTQVAALPTTINGLTHTFRPGIQWFGNAQERLGFNTAYDAVEGFDKYIEGVSSVIHHTDNIQRLRALATQIRYNASDEGIKRQVDAVRADDRLTEEEKKAVIDGIYEKGRYTLSNFVTELDEYTNLLANKKSRLDRTIEALMGRKFYAFAKWWENRVGANMIAGNIGSAVTNFIPVTQAAARVGKRNMAIGMLQTLSNLKKGDGFAAQSDFITNRRGSDTLVSTGLEKVSKAAGFLMEGIDNFVSESITRAAYRHYLQQGFSEAEALHQADIFAAGVLGDRSKGAMPTLFSSTNPVFKAFTQFQLEVNNQFSEVFKDLPREVRDRFPESKGRQAGALLGVLLEYFIGAFLFNDLYEELFGRRPALDPLGMLNNTVGDLTGYELPNLIGMWEGGITGEDFRTEKVGLGEAGTNLATEALGNLPFSSGLTLLGVELDGGRIPASSAVPNLSAIWQAATEEGWSGEKRWKEIKDELWKLSYVLPPFGGNQAQKVWKGLEAYFKGGSYSVDKDGNDILQYPVFKDDDVGDFKTALQAALFGKSSLDEAQDWVGAGFNSLGAKQTAVYQDLLDADVDDRDAWELIRALSDARKTEEESQAEIQRRILEDSHISGDGKAIVYYGLLASESERELMDQLEGMRVEPGDIYETMVMLRTDGLRAGGKAELLAETDLPEEAKRLVFFEKVTDSREDEIESILASGVTFDEFLEVYAKHGEIDGMEMNAGGKAAAFAYWVDSHGFAEEQMAVIKDQLAFFTIMPASASRYEKLTDSGMDPADAYALSTELGELEPEEGEDEEADAQKWRTCIDFSDNPAVQMSALMGVMTPAQYTKLEIANNMDVEADTYVRLYEIRGQFDADGNGSYKNVEIQAAIDSMTDYNLTNEQKAVLWQLVTGSTSARNNPYSTVAGQRVIDARNFAKEE